MVKQSFTCLFLGIVFLSFVFWAKPAEAILGFGGRILEITLCDEGELITIGPPRPGLFLLTPGSLIFSWYQIRKGPWAFGAYVPGGICTILGFPVAFPLGTITIIGTSLF
ncbi:MAG: hypothetical protein Q8N22_02110 [bacterium]|nr:hypothetical protein [bacterium]